jgi:hypothetical protein
MPPTRRASRARGRVMPWSEQAAVADMGTAPVVRPWAAPVAAATEDRIEDDADKQQDQDQLKGLHRFVTSGSAGPSRGGRVVARMSPERVRKHPVGEARSGLPGY